MANLGLCSLSVYFRMAVQKINNVNHILRYTSPTPELGERWEGLGLTLTASDSCADQYTGHKRHVVVRT